MYIGIWGGSQGGRAAAIDADGKLIAWVEGGPLSPRGFLHAGARLSSLFDKLRQSAGMNPEQFRSEVEFMVLCIAGVVDELSRQKMEVHLGSSGLLGIPHKICENTEIALIGGSEGLSGILLYASAGCVVWGRGTDGRVIRVDGWGEWLGDRGGGVYLGVQALRTVLWASASRGPKCNLLEDLVLEYADVAYPSDLTTWLDICAEQGIWRQAVTELAECVFRAAEQPDGEVARDLIDSGVGEILRSYEAAQLLIKQGAIDLGSDAVIVSGSLFVDHPTYRDSVIDGLKSLAPPVSAAAAEHGPLVGALVYAAARGGKRLPEPSIIANIVADCEREKIDDH